MPGTYNSHVVALVSLACLLLPNALSSQDSGAVVDSVLSRMTPEERVGQLLMVGLEHDSITRGTREKIRDFGVGGVVLYDRNIPGMDPRRRAQARMTFDSAVALRLSRDIEDMAGLRPSLGADPNRRLPLFVAMDQEGGANLRAARAVTAFPGALALGQAHSLSLTRRIGRALAQEMLALGVNMVFTPVADVSTNEANDIVGERAFGGHPALVSAQVSAFIEGLNSTSIVGVAKHFPGHGDSSVNPHDSLPVVRYERSRISNVNIPPFRSAILAGTRGIMPAHIEFASLRSNRGLPASLDRAVVTDLLRDSLAFGGLVVGDDLSRMGAITKDWDLPTAARLALEAGTDVLMFSRINTFELGEVQRALLQVYESDPALVNASVRRVLTAKLTIDSTLSSQPSPPGLDRLTALRAEHRQLVETVSDSAVVVITEKGKLVESLEDTEFFSGSNFPLEDLRARDTILLASAVTLPPDWAAVFMGEQGVHTVRPFPMLYGFYNGLPLNPPVEHPTIAEFAWNGSAVERSGEALLAASRGVKAIVVVIATRYQAEQLEILVADRQDVPIFVVAVAEPYRLTRDILSAPNVVTLSLGSNVEASFRSLTKALYGEIKPRTASYTTVSIPDWIDREHDVGPTLRFGEEGPAWLRGSVWSVVGRVLLCMIGAGVLGLFGRGLFGVGVKAVVSTVSVVTIIYLLAVALGAAFISGLDSDWAFLGHLIDTPVGAFTFGAVLALVLLLVAVPKGSASA